MHDALAGTASPDEEKEEQFKEQREKLQIAGLLHDIGVSPFSHVLEKFFTPGISHEAWGRLIIEDTSTEVGERLSKSSYKPSEVSALIGKEPSKPRYLHLIASSQMDADRFDYLLRDGHHTGNPCGSYDLERILRTITLGRDDTVRVMDKGKYATEGYLVSRYMMYNQVYLHKTTLCFEILLRRMLDRAITLSEKGGAGAPEVPTMGDTPISRDMKVTPSEYVSVTDHEILTCVRKWTKADDGILSDLAKRFLWRQRIFKPVKDPKIDADTLIERLGKMQDILTKHGLDHSSYLYVSLKEARDAYTPYSPQKEDQENAIFLEDGREISEELQSLTSMRIGPIKLICVPEEFRNEVEEVLK